MKAVVVGVLVSALAIFPATPTQAQPGGPNTAATKASPEAPQASVGLPHGVLGYIVQTQLKDYEAARKKGLSVRASIYGIDHHLHQYEGGFLIYRNDAGTPVAAPISLKEIGGPGVTDPLFEELLRNAQWVPEEAQAAAEELKLKLAEANARYRLASITYEQDQRDPDPAKQAEARNAKIEMVKEQAAMDLLKSQIDHPKKPQGGEQASTWLVADEQGVPQDYQVRTLHGALGRDQYELTWKPSKPAEPGATRMLAYLESETKPLKPADGRISFTTEQLSGSNIAKTFFLVIPTTMMIDGTSKKPTSKQTIGEFDIYLWEQEVKADTPYRFRLVVNLNALAAPPQTRPAIRLDDKEAARAAVATATTAAETWLKLVDDGKYAESWDAAAPALRSAVAKDAFVTMVSAARQPLGKLVSRKLLSARYRTSLPGAPDGEYVVIQYETQFANKKQTVETVTPMQVQDKSWQVSGYYVK